MKSERVIEAEGYGVKFADHLSDQAKDEIAIWYLERIKDPSWVANLKSRSDEADDWMRRRGLLPGRATDRRFSPPSADRPGEPQP